MVNYSMLDEIINSTFDKLNIFDDVNDKNIEIVREAYNKSVLYIDKKFDLPLNNDSTLVDFNSKTLKNINKFLSNMEADVKNGKHKIILNETQYINFKSKVILWSTHLFKEVIDKLDKDEHDINVLIHNDKISKHEWMFISLMFSFGVQFTIICKNYTELNNNIIDMDKHVNLNILKTNDNLDYKKRVLRKYKDLNDVETALYENKEPIQLIINGVDNYRDTCDFYGKLNKECKNNPEFRLFTESFNYLACNRTFDIPNIKLHSTEYIITTCINFINIENKEYSDSIKKAIKERFNKPDLVSLDLIKFFNKIKYCVITLNTLFNNNFSYLIYYGKVKNSDKVIFDILNISKIVSFIILTSEKELGIELEDVSTLELSGSEKLFDMPTVDYRDNARTLAVNASREVDKHLYSDNTLGLYKPGQFSRIDVKLFSTTFDEIELWKDNESHLRPGFMSSGNVVNIPTMFKVIKGNKWDNHTYVKYIQSLNNDKTLFCTSVDSLRELYTFSEKDYTRNDKGMYFKNLTDINKTMFDEQKPFIKNNKLIRDKVVKSVNYQYGFLSNTKQNIILDVIDNMLSLDLLNNKSGNIVDDILNVTLNINKEILKIIQWNEFYSSTPRLVLGLTDETMLNKYNIILLLFLYFIGFDVLIFVPTGYTSIENLVSNKFMYDEHIIGESYYNIDLKEQFNFSNKPSKKKGLFNKLFSK